MSYASAIAVVMGLCQLAALIVIILFRRRLSPAATMGVASGSVFERSGYRFA